MIFFVVTPEHSYTLDALLEACPDPTPGVVSYEQLFAATSLPPATYVFTDLDRLPKWGVRKAAKLYRELHAGGARVLNDPARVMSRYGLLRALYRRGLNSFNAYRLEEDLMPERWPVFLRAEGDHDAPLTDLLHTPDQLRGEINRWVESGLPVSSLLIVEYAAEPVRPGLFRVLTIYRLGETYVADCCSHDDQWVIKHGKSGIAPGELYDEELVIVRDNLFEAALRPVFELAGVDYGRADFSLVNGKVQTYEINTNPHVGFATEHPFPVRQETYKVFRRKFFDALARLS